MKTRRRDRTRTDGEDNDDKQKTIPLKDEPVVPLDDLQELLAANLDAMEKLHKVLTDPSGTNQSELAETVAAATSNAVRKLLEQRQRNFE